MKTIDYPRLTPALLALTLIAGAPLYGMQPASAGDAAIRPSDSQLATQIEGALDKLSLNVRVEIGDGRAKGGERVLILTYRQSGRGHQAQLGEVARLIDAGRSLNRSLKADFDGTILVAESAGREAQGIVGAHFKGLPTRVQDIALTSGEWTVKRLKPGFLPEWEMSGKLVAHQ